MMGIRDQLLNLGFTSEQIASATMGGKPLPDDVEAPHRYGTYRSKWETLYAMELQSQKRAGLIDEWMYEPMSLMLTAARIVNGKRQPAVRYTPDFLVWDQGDDEYPITFIEIKGQRREAGIARFRVAADKFRMFRFRMLTRKDGEWKEIG